MNFIHSCVWQLFLKNKGWDEMRKRWDVIKWFQEYCWLCMQIIHKTVLISNRDRDYKRSHSIQLSDGHFHARTSTQASLLCRKPRRTMLPFLDHCRRRFCTTTGLLGKAWHRWVPVWLSSIIGCFLFCLPKVFCAPASSASVFSHSGQLIRHNHAKMSDPLLKSLAFLKWNTY